MVQQPLGVRHKLCREPPGSALRGFDGVQCATQAEMGMHGNSGRLQKNAHWWE